MKTILTTKECSEHVKLSIAKINRLTHKKQIPHIKKDGKIVFELSTLNTWMNSPSVKKGILR